MRLRPDTTSSVFDIPSVRSAFAAQQVATLQRLHLRESAAHPDDLHSYDQGPAVPVASAMLQQIQILFQRRVFHQGGRVKTCAPNYGVLLTLPSTPHGIHLALCFECGIVGIYEAGSQINADDFDAIAPELASLIKPLFPDDPVVQRLK